jgi:hypothetical protein
MWFNCIFIQNLVLFLYIELQLCAGELSCAKTLADRIASPNEVSAFRFLWKSKAPSKVTAYVWQLLLDRVPTYYNLQRQGIVLSPTNNDCVTNNGCLIGLGWCWYYLRIFLLVWTIYVVLVLWKNRDKVCYWLRIRCFGLYEEIKVYSTTKPTIIRSLLRIYMKVLSWKWFLITKKANHYLLYEWLKEPILCLLRY